MSAPLIRPRRTWIERLTLGFEWALVALGLLGLAGWLIPIEPLVQPAHNAIPLGADTALCALALGAALLAIDLGHRRYGWLAVLATLTAGAALVSSIADLDLGLERLLVANRQTAAALQPQPMSAMVAAALLTGSLAILWWLLGLTPRLRLPGIAIAGTLIALAGIVSLDSHFGGMAAACWGAHAAASPLASAALVLLGGALFLGAWHESALADTTIPRWAPIPAILAGALLSLIFWRGLRERQALYIDTDTQNSLTQFATALDREIESTSLALAERVANPWSQRRDDLTLEHDASALAFFEQESARGCVSLAWVDPERLVNRYVHPHDGNEALIAFNHAAYPARSAALLAARHTRQPASAESLVLPAQGCDGFALYAPILRGDSVAGFAATEYRYATFFASIDRRIRLAPNYHVSISVDGHPVFQSTDEPAQDRHALAYTVSIRQHRYRIGLQPSPEFLRRQRQYLPEIALFAGIGITILLALSIHFARTARAGMLAAQLSNRRLRAENDERLRVETRLKVSDERLRLALDSTGIGILEWHVPTGRVYYSPALWSMLGYDQGRMPSTLQALQSLIHTDDLPLFERRTHALLAGATIFIDPEFRVRAHAGDWRYLYLRAKTVALDAHGSPQRIIGTLQDISARRTAEESARASQAAARKLSLVAARTDNLVIILAPDGRTEWVNESFTRTMGYTPQEIAGHRPADLLTGPETSSETVARLRAALAHGSGGRADIVLYNKAGRAYHLSLDVQPVRDEAGAVTTFIAVGSDITTRVETEQALRLAKSQADEASRAKSEFLAAMSHEIRTPLNGVLGMASLLLEGGQLTADQRECVGTIRTSSEALLAVLNDILDFSTIESGRIALQRIPLEIASCIEETLEFFACQAAAKRLALAYALDPAVPALVLGDPARLRQILAHLVNNAVKFTHAGSIAIEVRPGASPAAAEPGLIEFVVRDTGIGISAERVHRLFQAFSQCDGTTTRRYGGTGLGLAISQRLCALMGGSMRIESTEGQGTTVIFSISAQVAESPATLRLPDTPVPLRTAPVCLIGGHPVNRRRLIQLFEAWGVACLVLDAGDDPDTVRHAALLVVDETAGSLPELLDRLAAHPAPRLFLRHVRQPDGTSAPRVACGQLTLPFKNTAIHQAVAALFAPAGEPPATSTATVAHAPTLADAIPLSILLAEDNLVNRKIAQRLLLRLGYDAETADNGQDAVTRAQAHPFQLILMDLQMPEMDGLEASRRIRATLPPERQPKIVALTANAIAGDRERCIEAGMDDYITKPVRLHDIEAVIRRQFPV